MRSGPGRLGMASRFSPVAAANPAATRRTYESLRAAEVVVSLRQDRIRVSPHLYNTEADIARCLQVLRSIS